MNCLFHFKNLDRIDEKLFTILLPPLPPFLLLLLLPPPSLPAHPTAAAARRCRRRSRRFRRAHRSRVFRSPTNDEVRRRPDRVSTPKAPRLDREERTISVV